MKHKQICLFAAAAAGICGFGLRLWNLIAGKDETGLPVWEHPSVALLLAASLLFLLVFLVLSVRSPGRSGEKDVLRYNRAGFGLSCAGAALILISVAGEFARSLVSGPGFSAPLLCLLGIAAGFCLLGIAGQRHRGKEPMPPAELVPSLYLVIRLVFDFRDWSTDPMILDYCTRLFALIFMNLAFYHSAGFCFGKGKPRRTLFYSLAAVFFSAVSLADCFTGGWPAAMEYLGAALWLLPVTVCLLRPRQAPPEPEEVPEGETGEEA